jgi:hypothetical protein
MPTDWWSAAKHSGGNQARSADTKHSCRLCARNRSDVTRPTRLTGFELAILVRCFGMSKSLTLLPEAKSLG